VRKPLFGKPVSPFESLETRVLPAGDLALTLGTPTTRFDGRDQNQRIFVPVTIENVGDARITNNFQVVLFLSSDTTAGNDYQYNSKSIPVDVFPGQVLRPNLSVAMPHDLFGVSGQPVLDSGAYHIRGLILYDNGATDASAANNSVITPETINITYTFGGPLPKGNFRNKLTTVARSLDVVSFDILGAGRGELDTSNGGMVVRLFDTNGGTKLRIKVLSPFGSVTLDGLEINGPIDTIEGSAVTLAGNFTVTGNLGLVRLAAINGSQWRVDGDRPWAARIGSVVNTSLDSSARIQELNVGSWFNTDNNTDAVIAPRIDRLISPGTFRPDVVLSGAGSSSKPALGRAIVGSSVSGKWDINGGADTVLLQSTVDGFAINVRGTLKTLSISADLRGIVAAATIRSVFIGGNMTDAAIVAGTDFGSDANIGGTGTAADTFGPGRVVSFHLRGNMTGSLVSAALNPINGQYLDADDRFASGDSLVGSVRVNGALTGSSFYAPRFGKAILNGKVINTATDPNFVSNLPFTE